MKRSGAPLPSGPGIWEALLTLAALAALDYALGRWLPGGAGKWSAASLYRIAAARSLELLALAVWWRLRGFSFSSFGFDRAKAAKGIGVGLLLSLTLGGIAFGAEMLTRRMGWDSFLRSVSGPKITDAFGALLLAAVVVGPFFEELVFRGLLYGSLRRRLGIPLSMLASVLLFAALHLPQGKVPWVQAVGGLVFALGLELTGSLWAPLTVHILGNLVLFTLPYF